MSPPEENTSPGDAEIFSLSDDFLLSEELGLRVHINGIRLIVFTVISVFTIEDVVGRNIDEKDSYFPACLGQETCRCCVYAESEFRVLLAKVHVGE